MASAMKTKQGQVWMKLMAIRSLVNQMSPQEYDEAIKLVTNTKIVPSAEVAAMHDVLVTMYGSHRPASRVLPGI